MVAFGTENPQRLQYKPSSLQLVLKDGKVMHLDVSVVINRVPLKAQHLKFLNNKFGQNVLTDSLPQHTKSSTIDMLVGNYCYFDLLGPQKLDVDDGLFLFNSKLGWILGGRTESTMTEQDTESHLLVGTVGTDMVDDKVNVHDLNITATSKPNLELFWNLEAISIKDSPRVCDYDLAL